MAKRKLAKTGPSVWNEQPQGKPARQCKNCGKWYHPRMKACPACGATNPKAKGKKKRKKAGRKAAPAVAAATNPIDSAIRFIETVGGLPAARKALERIEQIRNL